MLGTLGSVRGERDAYPSQGGSGIVRTAWAVVCFPETYLHIADKEPFVDSKICATSCCRSAYLELSPLSAGGMPELVTIKISYTFARALGQASLSNTLGLDVRQRCGPSPAILFVFRTTCSTAPSSCKPRTFWQGAPLGQTWPPLQGLHCDLRRNLLVMPILEFFHGTRHHRWAKLFVI